MERADRAAVATFHAAGAWGAEVALGDAAAHHAMVKRLAVGDPVRLSSGDGRRAHGAIAELARRRLVVTLDRASVEQVSAPSHVELWAPVGDRERMLLLAEKAVELGASAWRPVVYRRSRSVSPRGEGEGFREKVRARMIGALEQSGSAWLPVVHAEVTLAEALASAGALARGAAQAWDADGSDRLRGVLMDAAGAPLASFREDLRAPVALALGPEGGLEPAEREQFLAAGWRAASIGANVLRFETAGIAALALVRSFIP